MQWTDNSILLSTRKYGENSALVRLLSRENGVYSGVIRGIHSKTNRGVLQAGNIVSATWQARLSEQLGTLKTELIEANTAHIMQDGERLNALSCSCSMIESALPERHPYPHLYHVFQAFLHTLRDTEFWWERYVFLELAVLSECGFGLDLRHCAATGTTEDLIYVSPKSGRAVSREAGEPYRHKLLPLPAFLTKAPSQQHAPSLTLPRCAGEGMVTVPLSPKGGGSGRGPDLTDKARELRKNQTEVEKKLWYFLRAHRFQGYGFRRQYPVGSYIVDFICLEQRLIIELDGGQHANQITYDTKRTKFLISEGYKVLRFWNNEVMENMEGVLASILEALGYTPSQHTSPPSLTLPRYAGEGMVATPLSPKGGGLGRGPNSHIKTQEILDGLHLTGYFLDQWLFAPNNKKLPAARVRLIQTIKETYGAEA